jgi:hypothetical protein
MGTLHYVARYFTERIVRVFVRGSRMWEWKDRLSL